MLLELIEGAVDFTKFKKQIELKLKLQTVNELQFVEQIFVLVKAKSRNAYYTKIDSYDGLIKVYKKMLQRNRRDDQEIKRLQTHIDELSFERNNLEKLLSKSLLENY